MSSDKIMSRDKFEELVGLKGVEIIRNRDLIKWCKQTHTNLHFFDSEKKVPEHVS